MKRIIAGLFSLLACFLIATPVHALSEIKIAILAPEGSAWHKVMTAWSAELEKRTSGRLTLKIYAGGVLGDEKDVIRKMRIGQVHAAGFTGLGLGIINPEVRVLELPMLVENYAEADAVTKKLQPKIEAGFGKKGFELLGWAETGFINIFSTTPIASRKDMDGKKMWAWEGDPLVQTMYEAFKISPVPLPITEVRTSLQTRLIDAIYTPPLGAIALQWYSQTPYMTDLKLADATGGILISKRALAGIAAGDRAILKETARTYAKQLVARTREDNEKSYATLKQAGVTTVKVPPEEVERIRTTSRTVWTKLVGTLYPKALLDEAIAAVEEYRQTHKSK